MTQPPIDQAVIVDPKIDASAFMLDGIDTSGKPLFTVAEVSKVFFDRSPHWMRWLEKEGVLFLDSKDLDCTHVGLDEDDNEVTLIIDGECAKCGGKEVGQRRTPSGARVYDLADIEQVSHAMAQHQKISGAQLHLALLMVNTSARISGYLG